MNKNNHPPYSSHDRTSNMQHLWHTQPLPKMPYTAKRVMLCCTINLQYYMTRANQCHLDQPVSLRNISNSHRNHLQNSSSCTNYKQYYLTRANQNVPNQSLSLRNISNSCASNSSSKLRLSQPISVKIGDRNESNRMQNKVSKLKQKQQWSLRIYNISKKKLFKGGWGWVGVKWARILKEITSMKTRHTAAPKLASEDEHEYHKQKRIIL